MAMSGRMSRGNRILNYGSTRKTPVWVPASGRMETRIKKARFYLRKRAWVPGAPREGDKAYLVVLCNLRRYHELTAGVALKLVREHYNPRCVAADGTHWGWDDFSILKKFRQAGGRGMYPTLGVADPKAKRRAARLDLERQVRQFFRKCIAAGGCCAPSEVREAFRMFRRGEPINERSFGKAFTAVTGFRPFRPFGRKLYRGFHLAEPFAGFIREKQTRGKLPDESSVEI